MRCPLDQKAAHQIRELLRSPLTHRPRHCAQALLGALCTLAPHALPAALLEKLHCDEAEAHSALQRYLCESEAGLLLRLGGLLYELLRDPLKVKESELNHIWAPIFGAKSAHVVETLSRVAHGPKGRSARLAYAKRRGWGLRRRTSEPAEHEEAPVAPYRAPPESPPLAEEELSEGASWGEDDLQQAIRNSLTMGPLRDAYFENAQPHEVRRRFSNKKSLVKRPSTPDLF